jgi:hypothetical protein
MILKRLVAVGSFWFVPSVEIGVNWLRGNDLVGRLAEGELFAQEGELAEGVVA